MWSVVYPQQNQFLFYTERHRNMALLRSERNCLSKKSQRQAEKWLCREKKKLFEEEKPLNVENAIMQPYLKEYALIELFNNSRDWLS